MIVILITFAILLSSLAAVLWLTRTGSSDVLPFWDDAAHSSSGQAPGGAHAPGEADKRDGERHAPMLPGLHSTAGCAGRPRSFSEGAG